MSSIIISNPSTGGGGVSSITAGTGLTGGTITSSGTIAVDGSLVAFRSALATVAFSGAYSDLTGTPTIPTAATPTALVGLTAITGVSPNYISSDSAPAIDQSIAPVWTGTHQFNATSPIKVGSTATSGIQTYNTSDQTTNYERGEALFSANTFFVRTVNGGTGTLRAINIGNSQNSVTFKGVASSLGGTQIFLPTTSGAGAVGVMVSGYTNTATSGQSSLLAFTPTYNQASGSAANTDILVNRTETALGSGAQFFTDFQVSASSRYSVDNNGHIKSSGFLTVASDFTVAASTVLASITGLSVNVKAAGTYSFEAILFVNADIAGGSSYALGGTATATSVIAQVNSVQNSTGSLVVSSRLTSIGSAAGQTGATVCHTTITGSIVVNAAGTLTIQYAQQTASGSSVIKAGSHLRFFRS